MPELAEQVARHDALIATLADDIRSLGDRMERSFDATRHLLESESHRFDERTERLFQRLESVSKPPTQTVLGVAGLIALLMVAFGGVVASIRAGDIGRVARMEHRLDAQDKRLEEQIDKIECRERARAGIPGVVCR